MEQGVTVRSSSANRNGAPMTEEPRPPGLGQPSQSSPKRRRIETQIHRRKKAKKVFPLESEWDADAGPPPERLRMPAEKMGRPPAAKK